MTRRHRGLASLGAAWLLAGCTVFGVRSTYEAPNYKIVETVAEDLEIRQYGPRLAVETDNDGDQAFRRLFRYITGANQGARKIDMTVPVETAKPAQIEMTIPVEATKDRHMRFFLPAEFTAGTAPSPTDSAVRLVEVPEQTLAVLRYSGFGFQGSVDAHKAELVSRMEATSWRPISAPFAYFYDPPWTIPFLRRNEVLIEVASPSG